MAERKAKFSNNFSHVFSNGAPGISQFELNIDLNAGSQEEVISHLFRNKIVADCETIPGASQRFIYDDEGKMDSRIEFIKLVGTVNDDHVEEFRALASHFTSDSKYLKSHAGLPAFDLITMPIGTGSKEYLEWAIEQTTKDENTSTFTAAEKVEEKKPKKDAKVQIKESSKANSDEEEEEDDDEEEEDEK